MDSLQALRFGYLPYQSGGVSPGDRRRFPAAATKLSLNWELYEPRSSYDVLYVSSNADLTHFRRWPQDGTKIVFDMVDSYLEIPDWEPKALIRGAGKWLLKKHRHLEFVYRKTVLGMCERADLVVCATPEQQSRIQQINPNVHPILDFHEELQTLPPHMNGDGATIDLLWEGLGINVYGFSEIAEVLEALAEVTPIRLHLVTDLTLRPFNAPWPVFNTRRVLEQRLKKVEFYLSEWNPVTLAALSRVCDLGIIPLSLEDPFLRAKPENKLLIMWRLGLPTVVSATPAYERVMRAYGGPNWSCPDQGTWFETLKQAIGEPQLRTKAAEKGQRFVQSNLSTEHLLKRWSAALATLVPEISRPADAR